ncbi:acyl-CoA dehydrogenase family protein [Pseudohalocynthiibacter aestuariivivens]|jgi:putative acyl-CoA dehydrogenase|uniref:Acyl-CoA dehydrogenase family protein n=1 Tax=Pseudohalocynthiibacter aestuariivivens TaxID=1591409 RepID=A0ABV5JFH9_9RHOB|nr:MULTISPECIES: acyl-CoA dehydrogenase family protein [Pseudohalocynthiibacter]MBS9716452.1 acyl-CoA dehydrogenase family protein [Pseudohalocynthiibacter aestuariivivens]MCK0100739.1 acyl-CoA dehydrogenase family protein [Pseudohalocynthiibacter sp. F2068]
MKPRDPISRLPTHDVTNMPPHMRDQGLWVDDTALRDWFDVQGGGSHEKHMARVGSLCGADEIFEKANQANRFGPELRAFDRYGMRINQVEFHPAYHDLMKLAVSTQMHNFAWHNEGNAGHLGQAALTYMFSQVEGGVMCPMAMTYAAVPSLRTTPSIKAEWMPRILSTDYDARDIPAPEKTGAMIGMFMTEKQGGSDVRANSTVAAPAGEEGIGQAYLLTGHKFFCSAPMCDAFLVLAKTQSASISCFLVPRWRPDGTRNNLFIQRMKDKLGNKSNASTEMEFQDTYGEMLGEEGRGIQTIIEMVTGNRIYCAMASAGTMRQALVQALHHTTHRSAFQKRLIQQPLMQNVLADMALEVEAALALGLRVARAMDHASDTAEGALARIGTAVAKYWNCKRCPGLVAEALECHGGPGYVEESIMPRLYREAPLNSIWEGSGNVVTLDVLRAITREADAVPALLDELEKARGNDQNLDSAIDRLRAEFDDRDAMESRMRTITEMIALTLQGALLTQHAPTKVAEAFCASRLAPGYRGAFGTLPKGCDTDAIISRALGRETC